MHLLWVALCSVLPHLARSRCAVQESGSNVSPLLESLQCENDYESSVNCSWTGDGNATLQLWLHSEENREPCVPYPPPGGRGRVHCKVETTTFAIGVEHTFFFLNNETPTNCSSAALKPVRLSQHVRARPPVDLSTHHTSDGGRRISWSCPYPPSSSLSSGLRYQLSYRPADDNWTTEDVSDTSLTLHKQRLLPGHRYEARARTRARLGQWSSWSPVVTWQTPQDAGHPPSLHCVLDGETEVRCSWEMSTDLAHFISYQLTCRQHRSAPPEPCCVNPTVRPELRGTVLRYSCPLTAADPEHLLLELQPTHSAKTFNPTKHIRPKPPQKVKLKEKDSNWVVEWTKPNTPLKLDYEVCFYRTHHREPRTCKNTSALHLIIPGERLVPSQDYELQVRSLLVPGEGTKYEGSPSEWTGPEKWTSRPATWSVTYVVYFLIAVLVTVVFLVSYRVFPACQRRLVLWVESVPSPGKSKILSELKPSTSRPLMQSEDTSICKVLHFDAVSTCSSHASLWPMKETHKDGVEPDEGVWNCDNLSALEKVHRSDTSSMSFSGPYIFCQTSPTMQKSSAVRREGEATEDKASSGDPPSPAHCALFGDGYVCLPSRAVSRSTQDLVSNYDVNKQDQQGPDPPGRTSVQPDLGEAGSRDQPPAYTSTPFNPWPQGGHVKASGYCFLPPPK